MASPTLWRPTVEVAIAKVIYEQGLQDHVDFFSSIYTLCFMYVSCGTRFGGMSFVRNTLLLVIIQMYISINILIKAYLQNLTGSVVIAKSVFDSRQQPRARQLYCIFDRKPARRGPWGRAQLSMHPHAPQPTSGMNAIHLIFSSSATMSTLTAAVGPAKSRRRVARAFKMRGLVVQASALESLLNVLQREAPQQSQEALHAILDEIKERLMSAQTGPGGGGGGGRTAQLVVTKSLLADVVADLSRDGGDVTDESLQLLDAFSTPRLAYDSMRKHFTLMTDRAEKRSLHAEAIHKVRPFDSLAGLRALPSILLPQNKFVCMNPFPGRHCSLLASMHYYSLFRTLLDLSHQVGMFSQRYALVQQRILKQDLFRPKLVASGSARSGRGDDSGAAHSLTPVESLLGRPGVKFLLGMIVQVEEGRYYLEDHSAQVPLDLSGASLLTDGFITENSIVLIEGEMLDGVLHVHRMGSPIIESRTDAMDTIGLQNSDIFNSLSSLSEMEKMKEQELQHGEEGMFVVLSDVHLDNPVVLEKLDTLFEGFQDISPLPVFVLMGNFTSKPLSAARDGSKIMMGHFEELANLICKYPTLASDGRFVFVPGPNDPGMAAMMPRPPIPNYFTSSLRSRVPKAIFTSNPCRIRYFSREIVFCRQDVVSRFRRHCLLPPREDGDNGRTGVRRLAQHAVKSMLDQGHLCPLPAPSCPVYWQYDHALRLYPLPDAVVVGDRVDQYYETYAGCDAMNPGSFPNGFNFVVYRPLAEVGPDGQMKSGLEFSQID